MTADEPLTGRELEPAFGRGLPAPHDLVGELRERLEVRVAELRKARGKVLTREDTYVPIQALTLLSEGLTDYGRAFLKIAGETNGYIEDELAWAVGEQDGIPLSGMRVPDADGTSIKIDLDKRNNYDTDLDALMSAVAFYTMREHPAVDAHWSDSGVTGVRLSMDQLADVLIGAMDNLVACGKFDAQKTKVEALKTEIARTDPKVASTVNVTRTSEFKGIKVKREQPK